MNVDDARVNFNRDAASLPLFGYGLTSAPRPGQGSTAPASLLHPASDNKNKSSGWWWEAVMNRKSSQQSM